MLERHGFRAAVMKADWVEPKQRETWVAKRVEEGIDVLKLVAQKLQSSLAVEGELPEDGLAGYGDSGDDLMMALARKLVSGDADDAPVQDIFRQAQEIAAQADQLLVDDDWERS